MHNFLIPKLYLGLPFSPPGPAWQPFPSPSATCEQGETVINPNLSERFLRLFRRRCLEKLIQPIEDDLAHQAAVLHDAVIGSPFHRRRDHEFLPGVGQVVHADLSLPFDLLALILPRTDDDQGRDRDFGRVKAEPCISLDETGRLVHGHAPAPGDKFDGVAMKG